MKESFCKWIQKTGTELLKRWVNFLSIIIDPYVIVLTLMAVFLYLISRQQKDTSILFLLSLALSLLTGLLGGVLAKRWDDLMETKVINTRGQSANRNLQLLFNRAIVLENRVGEYLHRFMGEETSNNVTKEVLKTYLEEIILAVVSLEENILNSIEDWKDIVPEADIQGKIDAIRELKEQIISQEHQLEQVTREMKVKDEKSADEIARLKKEKERLTTQIHSNVLNILNETTASGINNLDGSLITGGSIISNQAFMTRYKSMNTDYQIDVPPGVIVTYPYKPQEQPDQKNSASIRDKRK